MLTLALPSRGHFVLFVKCRNHPSAEARFGRKHISTTLTVARPVSCVSPPSTRLLIDHPATSWYLLCCYSSFPWSSHKNGTSSYQINHLCTSWTYQVWQSVQEGHTCRSTWRPVSPARVAPISSVGVKV